MESRQMNSRKPPLKTCGISFIKIADIAYKKAQDFNGPFSSIIIWLLWFISIAYSPVLIALKLQLFATFSFIDYWIITLESIFEKLYPSSGYVFNKLDELVGFAEILPRKFEDAFDRFPSIICQVPLIYAVWLRIVSCLDLVLSNQKFESVVRSKSVEGDYVLIEWQSKYKEDARVHSHDGKKDYTEWGLRNEINARKCPSFKEVATRWGSRNEANTRQESLPFKDDRLAKKWGSRNETRTRQVAPSFKAREWGPRNEVNTRQEYARSGWGSRNEANTRQEPPRFKTDFQATKWVSRNETNARQESPWSKESDRNESRTESETSQESQLVKQDSFSRKRVSESEPIHHQESQNPNEYHKFTNWESRKKQDTRQQPQSTENDQEFPPSSLPSVRSYKDVLAKGAVDGNGEKGISGKGEKGSGGKGERRRRKKRWSQLKW
ncbi:hypothetical protein M5689_019776 [Euphorbia peplus]|nr:hypothetical protein M5689_019776 [Euphorbia peplus]